jgi:hypothetical protein
MIENGMVLLSMTTWIIVMVARNERLLVIPKVARHLMRRVPKNSKLTRY